MRDQDQRAGKLEQSLLEHLEGGDVEIVGRLVEQQQVGLLEHQPGDVHAGALAAGEAADGLDELFLAEQKAPRPAVDVHGAAAVHDGITLRRERPFQRQFGIDLLPRLFEIQRFQRRRAADLAAARSEFALQHSQQRRLAAAVRSGQTEPCPGRGRIRDRATTAARRIQTRPARFDQLLRAAAAGREFDERGRTGAALVQTGQIADQAHRLADPGLRLPRAGLGAAPQPFHLPADQRRQRLALLGLGHENSPRRSTNVL